MRKYANYALLTLFFISLSVVSTVLYVRYQTFRTEEVQGLVLDSLLDDADIAVSSKDGKSIKRLKKLRSLYAKVQIDSLSFGTPTTKFRKALNAQRELIGRQSNERRFGNIEVTAEDLERVVDILQNTQDPEQIKNKLNAYQLSGADEAGNVRYTGYYSPELEARYRTTAGFTHPIYLRSKQKNDNGLEIAYVRSSGDARDMRVEGSAFLRFPDGRKVLVTFNGDFERMHEESESEKDVAEVVETPENQPAPQPRQSETGKKVLTKYAAVFSQKDQRGNAPVGVELTPLTADVTIAVDRRFIPIGAVLLAQVPIVNDKGELLRHEYRFVLAQDVGSAIKGKGHVDLYMGEGENAKQKAQHLSKYGKLWLLLPKNSEEAGLTAQKL